MENHDVSVSLPQHIWKDVLSLIESERGLLLNRAGRVENPYRDILEDDAQKLSVAFQEIKLNLTLTGN